MCLKYTLNQLKLYIYISSDKFQIKSVIFSVAYKPQYQKEN